MTSHRSLFAVLIVILTVVLAACGGEDGAGAPADDGSAADGDGAGHIHGLGIHPQDGSLLIATHSGLFAAAEGELDAERVSETTQDFMGFSVIDEDRFIGSGHPAPDQNLPPLLGLIESRDGGRTWENVSLLGEADFHALRGQGDRIYGFDGTQGRLMASRDGGRNWEQRVPPAGVYDLAIDPNDSDRLLASTEQGLFVSRDAGTSWRQVNDELAGLLAWANSGRPVYLVDNQGRVLRSDNAGRDFEATGQVNGQPVAFMAHEEDLYVALSDGSVQRSDDAGATWTQRATV